MKNHLQRRGAIYYFRRAVPADLRAVVLTRTGKPRTEWVWSLKTADYATAKRLAANDYGKTEKLIDQALAALDANGSSNQTFKAEPSSVVSQALVDQMEQHSIEAAIWDYQDQLDQERRGEEDPAFAANLALRAAAARLDREREDLQFARELRAEERQASAVGVMDLFERYASADGRNVKTIAQWRPYLRKLIEYLGQPDASRITTKDIIRWRNHLRDEVEFRGNKLTAKTINGSYLAAVNVVFAWAVDDGLLETNAARDVKPVREPKKAKLRERAFTDAEAATILRATMLSPTGREGQDFLNAKRWMPWLMCYSGARVGEIGQLRKQDIVCLKDTPAFRITPDAGTIKTKEARIVPIHPHLIDQGFLKFVEERPDGPLFFDPSKRRSENVINRQSNRVGIKLAKWVRSLGVDAPQPNHAWRHRFITLARRHELTERASRAIVGHATADEHGKYGEDEVEVMLEQLKKLPAISLL